MNERWHKTIIANYGSMEAWKEHMRVLGAKGGKVKNPNKGFGSSRQRAIEAAKKSHGIA